MGTEPFLQSGRERKKIERLLGEVKSILGLTRLRLRGPTGAGDEFLLVANVQNLGRLAKFDRHPSGFIEGAADPRGDGIVAWFRPSGFRKTRTASGHQPIARGSQVAIPGKKNSITNATICKATKGMTPM